MACIIYLTPSSYLDTSFVNCCYGYWRIGVVYGHTLATQYIRWSKRYLAFLFACVVLCLLVHLRDSISANSTVLFIVYALRFTYLWNDRNLFSTVSCHREDAKSNLRVIYLYLRCDRRLLGLPLVHNSRTVVGATTKNRLHCRL